MCSLGCLSVQALHCWQQQVLAWRWLMLGCLSLAQYWVLLDWRLVVAPCLLLQVSAVPRFRRVQCPAMRTGRVTFAVAVVLQTSVLLDT